MVMANRNRPIALSTLRRSLKRTFNASRQSTIDCEDDFLESRELDKHMEEVDVF